MYNLHQTIIDFIFSFSDGNSPWAGGGGLGWRTAHPGVYSRSLAWTSQLLGEGRKAHPGQRNWSFATNLNFQIPIFLLPEDVHLLYFKLGFFDLTEFIVWKIKHWVTKIKSLWQRLNSFKFFSAVPRQMCVRLTIQ